MLRGLLRFLAYSLLFWFIYRVVVGALRFLTHDSSRKEEPPPRTRDDRKDERPSGYGDVKDASFKDLPKDESKSS